MEKPEAFPEKKRNLISFVLWAQNQGEKGRKQSIFRTRIKRININILTNIMGVSSENECFDNNLAWRS